MWKCEHKGKKNLCYKLFFVLFFFNLYSIYGHQSSCQHWFDNWVYHNWSDPCGCHRLHLPEKERPSANNRQANNFWEPTLLHSGVQTGCGRANYNHRVWAYGEHRAAHNYRYLTANHWIFFHQPCLNKLAAVFKNMFQVYCCSLALKVEKNSFCVVYYKPDFTISSVFLWKTDLQYDQASSCNFC